MSTLTWETAERTDLSEHIGSITDEHVEQYWRDGWVDVKGFISPELCEQILAHYKEWSGFRWDEWPDDPQEQEEFRQAAARLQEPGKIFAARQADPWMFNYVTQPKLGEAAARLLRVPAVKIMTESMQIKFPKPSGRSTPIGWHQDGPFIPIDRMDTIQLWVALRPLTADMGCMVHMTGSHETAPMGMLGYAGEKPEELYPWLWDRYKVVEPHDMAQGDALWHHPHSWHYSATNESNKVRWGMSSQRMAANCLYTGQQNYNTDGLGLVPNKPFDHPNFPTVYDANATG